MSTPTSAPAGAATPGAGLRTAIIGGTGYAGGELSRLLLDHPAVADIVPTARGGEDFERVHPNLLGSGLAFTGVDTVLDKAGEFDVVFLCTPSGEAMRLAPRLLAAGTRVIDLSADFRFADPKAYETAYGAPHTAPDLLPEAVYGVTEFHRERIARARLVANPGCYVITALLGLDPLLRSGLAEPSAPLHIAATNGTTGAGVKPRTEILHAEVFGSMLPYSLQGHRHAPELETHLADAAGGPVTVDLSTAHGNFARGIYIQASVRIRHESRERVSRALLLDRYRERYGAGKDGEFFVRINDQGAEGGPTDKDYRRYPSLAGVTGSNFCHIGVDHDPRRGVAKVVAVTDNLVKGAAGSAIQNMNVMLGLDETTGLRTHGL
ncbi:N-acetyl-gamma-glutamyl-phosphate reductase [Streptomyces sp. AC602_WCS936]|uniref:N-acetyl-gamma-glutamyl-phosphate reductase n=1 Tax=Streptomyces sp. AC602_WCS936 TaxID=2823685 RepID=UPI001C273124|nr:N-acetyl-gamma-glutamyl-phosphate reductase [Streptomyces sp. AC602_WCS936]